MKALTLTQPWATLVMLGAKQIETRSWGASYRGPLLIHAAKALPKSWAFMRDQHFIDALEIGVGLNDQGVPNIDRLPRGMLLGMVTLDDVIAMTQPVLPDSRGRMIYQPPGFAVSDQELAFGDYTAGRYAWLLSEPIAFSEPRPARGRQRLWEVWLSEVVDSIVDSKGALTFEGALLGGELLT